MTASSIPATAPAPASAPVLAATVLLVRDGAADTGGGGLEVLMVLRHRQVDFASGALVFPGGKVDPGDGVRSVRQRCCGLDGAPEETVLPRIAAVRETFEEAGILLARARGEDRLVSGARLAAMEDDRRRLGSGTAALDGFLETHGLELACDLLQPFAHWITPEPMPRRYDTWFFLAAAPDDHAALHDGGETVDSVWIRPRDALADAAAGRRTIIFPTRMNLELLKTSATVAEALASARARPLVTVEPQLGDNNGVAVLRIPAEAGYPITEIPLAEA